MRDRTPEATLAVGKRQVPGIAEAMRAASLQITPRAMLSQGVSVIRKEDIDRQSSGKPQGSKRKSCLYSACLRTWAGDFCPAVKENVEIMFKDSYGRQITYMRISVTDRCNLRCIYCMPADGIRQTTHKEILTFDEIVRIARIGAGKGISRIKITGGEPLVRKNIAALIRMLKAVPGIEQVTLTTNGGLLNEQIDSLVKKRTRRGEYKSGYSG